MKLESAWKEYKDKGDKKVEVLCTDGDKVTGVFDELMEAYENGYDAIFLTHSRYGCVEIPLDEIVSITVME